MNMWNLFGSDSWLFSTAFFEIVTVVFNVALIIYAEIMEDRAMAAVIRLFGYVMGVRTLTRISRKYFTGLCMPEIIAWLISTAMLHLFLYVDSSPLHGLMFILSLLYVGLTHIRYSHFGYKDHLDLAYLYASLSEEYMQINRRLRIYDSYTHQPS